jgi:hypothetical protein
MPHWQELVEENLRQTIRIMRLNNKSRDNLSLDMEDISNIHGSNLRLQKSLNGTGEIGS